MNLTEKHNLSIHLRKESVRQSASGVITGVVYWKHTNVVFPDEQWSDSLPVILCWWLKSYHSLLSNPSGKVQFDFMDGPFSVRCSADGRLVRCQFVERKPIEEVWHSFDIDIDCLGREVCGVAREFLEQCRMKGLHAQDISMLKKNLSATE